MSERIKLALIGLAVLLAAMLMGLAALLSSRPLEAFAFFVFAGALVTSALAIVLTRDIVRSAMWLMGALSSAAGLYFLLGANFLGVVQLIVYAGGILVLLVFGVMLTGRSPFLRFEPRPAETALAALVGLLLFAAFSTVLLAGAWPALPGAAPGRRAATVREIGRALLTDYLLPFEIASVLLLAVMIGAAYLARPVRR